MSHRLLPSRPSLYHGTDKSRPYFEGWYFKQTSGGYTFVAIPGVFRGKSAHDDIAFIQVILGGKSHFFQYPFDTFKYDRNAFDIQIGKSRFSIDGIHVNINEIALDATLKFNGRKPLKTSVMSPSIMGPFSYLPGMQCNHGVLSLHHTADGMLSCGEASVRFENAGGYIEKDWGESFPESWIWMQCADNKTAFMCSAATIPYGIFRFKGLICVLDIDGIQYRFATYNGANVMRIEQRAQNILVEIKRGAYRLLIVAHIGTFGRLVAPTKTGMNRQIKESVNTVYDISLTYRHETIYNGRLHDGGLEMFNTKKSIE